MKNKTGINLLLALVLMMAYSCTQKAPQGFVIKGSIKGINEGRIKLSRYIDSNRTSQVIDSVLFKNGTFELKGKVQGPELMTLLITPGNWSMRLFLENGQITVAADTAGSEHYDYTGYNGEKGAHLKNVMVTGSKSQDELNQYENHPEHLKFKETFAQLNQTKGGDHEAMRAKADSVSKLYQIWQWNYINDLVSKKPASVAGAYILHYYYQFNPAISLSEVERTLAKFEAGARASVYYATVASEVEKKKRVAPGSLAPDFTLLKRDSTSFTLSSLKGKYIMIDFWASWCKPCREAIPHWKQVYQKYKDKGFEIVSVSDDSRWKDWFKALDQEQMPWIQVCDEFPVKNMPARVGTLYQAPSLPCYVLLDKEGKILVHTTNEKDIDDKLAAVFK